MLQYKEGYVSAAQPGRVAESRAAKTENAVTFLSREEHPEIFKLLATDDAFRAELRDDPCAALARHRITIDPRTVPDHVTLPEKGYFAGDVDQTPPMWIGLMA